MTREERLKALFDELERDAYNAEYHNYYYKEANQIIRKHFELSLPPAEGAEQRMRVRNILQDFYRRGEYELEQAEEDIMRLFQQQPTAEGAEEILEKEFPLAIIDEDGWTGGVLKIMHQFATLHAQRIADKMVSERLREELTLYHRWIQKNKYTNIKHSHHECAVEYLKTRENHE